jgi:hypothetical protein
MNQIQKLEKLAVDAFRDGQGWAQFWEEHAADVRNAEPWSRERFRRLVDRLLSLVTSGDSAGQYPIDDGMAQWEVDDVRHTPHDTITQARLQSPPEVRP